jgi:hypothetical protein
MCRLNRYSWLLIIVFIGVIFSMEYPFFDHHNPFEGLISAPVIIVALYWSQKAGYLSQCDEGRTTKNKAFFRDVYVISYSFVLGILLSLLFEHNNADARGWWPFIVGWLTIYGFLFASLFSCIAMLLNKHKNYTGIFAVGIVLSCSFMNFFPRYITILYFGKVDFFTAFITLLLGMHLLFSISYRILRKIRI